MNAVQFVRDSASIPKLCNCELGTNVIALFVDYSALINHQLLPFFPELPSTPYQSSPSPLKGTKISPSKTLLRLIQTFG